MSIGIFDSGVGGLTVMRKIVDLLPHENIVFFGDTARLPYGGKSPATIQRYCRENTQFLLEQNIKLLVVACNTASAHTIEDLQSAFDVPIIGVIEPGVKRIIESTKNGRVAILGTKGTIQSNVYQDKIRKHLPEAALFPIACPLFVHFVEEQLLDHPATRLIVREYLQSLRGQNIDTLMLGCTHYPLLMKLLREEMGPDVSIIDSATTCALAVQEHLQQLGLLEQGPNLGVHRYYVSDDPHKFKEIGQTFLGLPISQVELYHKEG